MSNLLTDYLGTDITPTGTSKKLTIDGATKPYPVYRVRLDLLYYNDQNDRIATWISQYNSEHGSDMLGSLDRQQYNDHQHRVQAGECLHEDAYYKSL